ncbi:hypothetical protein LTS10_007544 [Elasticomyces elasticus]|nr:hypothetical protein LTS10_007544 [Elasticomyces elasticus]
MAQNNEDERAHANILREAIDRSSALSYYALHSLLVTTDFEDYIPEGLLHANRKATYAADLAVSVSTIMLYAKHLLRAPHSATLHQGKVCHCIDSGPNSPTTSLG